jgi:glycosyltransferase involved in cell wall biosynthesis
MSKLRIINLLDDFALGGVTNGLKIFDSPELLEIADFQTVAIDPQAWIAPSLEADVIITHFPPNWRRTLWFRSLRMRNRTAKLIHVEHSYSKEWFELHVSNPLRFRMMMQLALTSVDHVVVVSNASKNWMAQEQFVKNDKLHAIYPYSNMSGLAAVPDIALTPNEPLVIGAYGRFCEAKGFDRLIEAFKQTDANDNLRLLIGGFGPDEQMLREKAAGNAYINFVGKVSDVAGFLRHCHVIAVPSRYESYGQVANEAREAGRPILVSRAGGLPEQVDGCGLIVDCDDSAALLAALQSLRAMPLQAMGRAGRTSTAGCRLARIDQWRQLLLREKAELARTLESAIKLAVA